MNIQRVDRCVTVGYAVLPDGCMAPCFIMPAGVA